jgi:membrane protease YdiL (CAAX protease family)
MSILHVIAQATAPSNVERFLGDPRVFGLLLLLAATIAWAAGVFRRDGILGPTRLEADQPVLPLLIITVIGGLVWIGSQASFGIAKGSEWAVNHPGERFDIEMLTAGEMAFLAIVPAGIALLLIVIGDLFAPNQLPRRIGYALRRLPMGVVFGVLAIFIVLPAMFAMSAITELIYRRAGVEHPSTHDLLKAMKSASPATRIALILGATLAAPMFEELLFRGHIQTLLVRLFMSRPKKFGPIVPLANVLPEGIASDSLPPPSIEPTRMPFAEKVEPESRRRRLLMTWLAVIITSVMFAAVHPLWMAPLIFILSISLGFAYERTGNLWVPIVVHALFNTSSTLIYLNLT